MTKAVEIINENAPAPVVLICEHASNAIPDHLQNLGLDQKALSDHIAWDLGALDVAKSLSDRLDCPLVAGGMSRLVYDCNRPPEALDAFPAVSEVYRIPGNENLSQEDIQWRIEAVHKPFQAALGSVVTTQMARTGAPLIVTIHSFTPVYKGQKRAVEVGILHDEDSRLADAMLGAAQQGTGLNIQRNAPYSATDGVTYTLRKQGVNNKLQNVMIEIRNDLIADAAGVEQIAGMLHALIDQALTTHQVTEETEAPSC